MTPYKPGKYKVLCRGCKTVLEVIDTDRREELYYNLEKGRCEYRVGDADNDKGVCAECRIIENDGQPLKDLLVVPKRYEEISFDYYQAELDWKEIKSKGGLYIYGGVGSGKTVRAYNLMAYLSIYQQKKATFTNVSTLFFEIKGDLSKTDSLINRLSKTDLLVIDDFGAEFGSDFELQIFYEIINRRWLDMLPIVITSNLWLADWAKKNNTNDSMVRLVDRLRNMVGKVNLEGNKRNP
jgi:hypothetical protein